MYKTNFFSRLIQKNNMTYYKQIDGKKYDARVIEMANELVAGQGDGRLSVDDAHKLIKHIKDAGTYTDVEKDTMVYVRDNYNWTDAADEWFREEIRKWAASK